MANIDLSVPADQNWSSYNLREFKRRCPQSYALLARWLRRTEAQRRAALAEAERLRQIIERGRLDEEPPLPVEPPSETTRPVLFMELAALVTKHGRVPWPALCGPRRAREYVIPRQALMWLAKKHCAHMSLPEIGRRLGGRDHTTILHGIRCVERNPGRFGPLIAAVEAELS